MGIIVTPPGRRNRQAETASQSAQRLRGLGMPETRGKNARGQNVRNEHAVPAISETTSISEISAAAETSTAIATTEQSPEPAKPTLRDLAGVKPSDKPTEQDRPKRDRPRLVFQPIHAVIAILTLSCALCASLTMLIQQAQLPPRHTEYRLTNCLLHAYLSLLNSPISSAIALTSFCKSSLNLR